jgi:hypothetical protein
MIGFWHDVRETSTILFMNNKDTLLEDMPGQPRRKPGRPKRGNTVRKSTVMLPQCLHDWAMEQPEGLSALVRRLLSDERARVRRKRSG